MGVSKRTLEQWEQGRKGGQEGPVLGVDGLQVEHIPQRRQADDGGQERHLRGHGPEESPVP